MKKYYLCRYCDSVLEQNACNCSYVFANKGEQDIMEIEPDRIPFFLWYRDNYRDDSEIHLLESAFESGREYEKSLK